MEFRRGDIVEVKDNGQRPEAIGLIGIVTIPERGDGRLVANVITGPASWPFPDFVAPYDAVILRGHTDDEV